MDKYYTSERNTQMLIYLMKAHGVRKIVASPGTTNVCLVGSLQQDDFFEIYSSVDERSAAYIACGLAAESGEPVALSCTGATASRNYLPGLTEAYYRKLPVLAITSTQHMGKIGSYTPQVIDRTVPLNDIVNCSVQIPTVHDAEDEWACEVALNKVLLELKRHGGGPVHINLTTTYSPDFSVKELPPTRVIDRFTYGDNFPELSNTARIGIYVGSHKAWTAQEQDAVDAFCAAYNAVVICDHTSNYSGKYKVIPSLVSSQRQYNAAARRCDVMIHIGEVSGAIMGMEPAKVWRVSPDGEIRDVFKKTQFVFEMREQDFFNLYAKKQAGKKAGDSYLEEWHRDYERILSQLPELPFSNAWIAGHTIGYIPQGSVLHLGIYNSLRCWNYFDVPQNVSCYCNTGGFGIDGMVSTLLGASLSDKNKLYFGVVGDLAFFYDLNALGNRHVGNNIRLLIINNGRGQEFRNPGHPASKFGNQADQYMAAAGHYGNQSRNLVRHYAEDLGYEYMSAASKEEYLSKVGYFTTPDHLEKAIVFEVFTETEDETQALNAIYEADSSAVSSAKKLAKEVLGEKGVRTIKKLIKH